jgi:hypothetical protein
MQTKRLTVTVDGIGELLESLALAKRKYQAEFGVFYSAERPGQVGDDVGNVVLFREPHHTDKEVKIAAARINALYFYDQLYVTDLVINQAA